MGQIRSCEAVRKGLRRKSDQTEVETRIISEGRFMLRRRGRREKRYKSGGSIVELFSGSDVALLIVQIPILVIAQRQWTVYMKHWWQ